jgi:hypothetical protein
MRGGESRGSASFFPETSECAARNPLAPMAGGGSNGRESGWRWCSRWRFRRSSAGGLALAAFADELFAILVRSSVLLFMLAGENLGRHDVKTVTLPTGPHKTAVCSGYETARATWWPAALGCMERERRSRRPGGSLR